MKSPASEAWYCVARSAFWRVMPTRISEFHWMRPNKTWRLMSMKTMGYVFHWYRRILKDYFTYWRFVWKFQARLLWHRSMSDHWCRSTGVFAKHPTSRCLIGSLFVRKERPRQDPGGQTALMILRVPRVNWSFWQYLWILKSIIQCHSHLPKRDHLKG